MLMKRIAIACLMGGIAGVAMACPSRPSTSSAAIEIQTEDVERFYRVYEMAGGRPTAEQLQRDYLDLGTAGLRHLIEPRA
jgi:hypothetical protein